MKMTTLKLKTLILCSAMIILSSGYCIASELMFKDTFFTTDGMYINDDIYAVGRQSGTVAPLDYAGDGDSTDNAIIGDTEKPSTLILENEAYVSPNYNFTDIGTNFIVEFDLMINRIDGTSWAGFGLHIGSETQHDVMNENNVGINWWLQKGNGAGEAGPALFSEGQVAALGNRIRFKSIELLNFESELVHINCIVSTKSFGGTDKVTTALFVNGEPITAHQRNGTVGYGTVFELDQAFTNNFLIYGFGKDSSVDCNVNMSNFVIKATEPKITSHSWTNDATSLINSSKIYTHAVNCYGPEVTINGVTFNAALDGSQPWDAGTNWLVMDYNNNWGIGTGTDPSTTITGDSAGLATTFFFSRISSTLMLYHLVPGLQYTLTLYNNSSSTPLDSRIIPSDSEAALSILDQNGTQGSIFKYTYIAPANGTFSVTFDNSPVDSPDVYQNWRLYAFSNEQVVPECSLFLGFLTMAGLFIRKLKV